MVFTNLGNQISVGAEKGEAFDLQLNKQDGRLAVLALGGATSEYVDLLNADYIDLNKFDEDQVDDFLS